MKEHLSEDFIHQLFKLTLKDRKYLELLIQHMKYEYFPEESYKRLWRVIQVEFNINGSKKPPTLGVLHQHFRKDIEVLQVLSDTKDLTVDGDEESILRNLEIFLKQNLFVLSYNEIGELYNKDKKDEAYKEFKDRATEFTNFSLFSNSFDKVFEGWNRRVFERQLEKAEGSKRVRIATGIDELDSHIKGFETGEFIMIMGDSGSGKSFLGNHLGVNAARRGYNVYHAQAEGTREQVLNRYDANWTGSRYYEIKENDIDEKKKKSLDRVISRIGGEIFVEAFEQFDSKTIVDVRNSIIEIKKQHDLKYVILDYMDLIDPGDGKKYEPSMERFRQQKVARACKNIAVEQNVVFVTFTQASSISPDDLNNPNFAITRFNLAEDKGKIRPADLFITINRTKDERKEQICRLYVDKAREHQSGQTIYIKQNLSRSRFYDKKKTLNEFFNGEES